MLPDLILLAYPNLASDDATVIGPPDRDYNCVAWAVGVTDDWWWPGNPRDYWPPGVPRELTVPAFVAALATVGYAPCADGGAEPGWEKAAVYAKGGVPTHVARQLPGGRWSSKLGADCLIGHATPAGVEGAVYGAAVAYLRRPA